MGVSRPVFQSLTNNNSGGGGGGGVGGASFFPQQMVASGSSSLHGRCHHNHSHHARKPCGFPRRHGSGHHDPSDPSVQQALRVLQGTTFDIVDILSAMKLVPHDIAVQERGCERLWILSWEDENSAAIGRVGGISIILNAMSRFPMNAHLQQCGCESLQNLASINNYNRREIVDLGGVSLIVQAMMRHLSCAGIQQCGCTALASIATCKGHHKDIMGAGGVHAICIAARNFADEESVLRSAYDAITALGLDPAMGGLGRLPSPPPPVIVSPPPTPTLEDDADGYGGLNNLWQ